MKASEPLEEIVEAWAKSHRQLWSLWLGQDPVASKADAPATPAGPLDSAAWLGAAANLWGREGVLGRTLGSLLSSQEMLGRSLELLTGAWRQVLPMLEQDEDWQPALRRYLDQWVEQVVAVPGQSVEATKEAAQLLNSMMLDWSPVLGPLLGSAWKAGLSGNLGAALLQGSEGFDRLLAMEQEFEPAIAGLAEVPRAGLLRERNARLLTAMDAAIALRGATVGYQAIVAKGLAEAVQATITHIIEQAEAGTPVSGVRGLVRTWFRIADQTLMHTFSSAEFIEAQNEVAAASMDYKIRQRELLSMIYEALEIPTRDEMDDLYRSLHELKREVRTLRRAARESRRPVPPADPKAAARGKKAARKRPSSATSKPAKQG